MMSNPLYSQYNKTPLQANFEAFARRFSGDPKAQVQQLLNSGRMSQEQFNRLQQMAQQYFGAKF